MQPYVSLSIFSLPNGFMSALLSLPCDVIELPGFDGAGTAHLAYTADQLCISWPLQSMIKISVRYASWNIHCN